MKITLFECKFFVKVTEKIIGDILFVSPSTMYEYFFSCFEEFFVKWKRMKKRRETRKEEKKKHFCRTKFTTNR